MESGPFQLKRRKLSNSINECKCTRCRVDPDAFALCNFQIQEEMSAVMSQMTIEWESRVMDACDNTKVIHVLTSHGSKLDDFVVNALRAHGQRNNIKLEVIILSLSEIRNDASYWTICRVIQFLIDCHCYFIVSHPHQGTQGLQWCTQEFYTRLQSLSARVGFPSGENLKCPVFTQNKGLYLLHAQEFCNPTLLVDLKIWNNSNCLFYNNNLISGYVVGSAQSINVSICRMTF
jgi:hypothetical protein